MFKHGTTKIAWSAIMVILSVGGFLIYPKLTKRTSEPTPVSLIKVEKGTVEDIINESGIVELGEQQTLKAPVDGTVAAVLVKEGDRISSNQKLVLLQDPKRQTSLTQHELEVKKTQLEIAGNSQKVANAKETLTVTQKKLEADQALFDRGFISENELQSQKDAVRNAESNLQEIQRAVSQGTIQLQLLQLKGKELGEELQKNLVAAPASGKVLEVKIKRGDVVKLGDPLLTIGDSRQEVVKLALSTLNASKVRLNQEARISRIGPSSETFAGRVKSLSLIASTSNNVGTGQNQATISAIVELNIPSGKLIPGSSVSVDIILEQQKDVVVLQTGAIQRFGAETFVWVQDEQGLAQKRPVTLGMEGLTTIAIKSGLQPGEKILQPLGNTPLQPGMPVKAIDNPMPNIPRN